MILKNHTWFKFVKFQ